MSIRLYKNGQEKLISGNPQGDNIPVGSEIDYDGNTIPTGWQEITNPNVYSTSEVKTDNVWINGKPIYRQVFNGNFNTSTASDVRTDIDVSNLNIEKTISFNGFIDSTNPCALLSYNGLVLFFPYTNVIRVYNKSQDYLNEDFYLILEYTKTTDTANS